MNNKARFLYWLFFAPVAFLLLTSCKNDAAESTIDPENLQVDITISEDGSGIIDVIATANNTTNYTFYSNNSIGDSITNTTGVFTYTYAITGVYTLQIRAYGSSGRYLKQEFEINIEVDGGNMNLVWQDEFNGSALNTSDWSYDNGDGCPNLCGWGNNELEYYKEENVEVANGYLTLEARDESFGGRNYTSGKIKTLGKKEFKYGRIDIRAILPKGQGIWPALWMLGTNISTVGWPACGEIDIIELIGGGSGRDNKTYGTIHWDSNGYASYGGNYTLSSGIFNDEFHVFTIIWTSESITWFVDDVQFHIVDITPSGMSEFHENMYLIFNVAVGGNWPGSPDATTVFPQQMVVDYIRVFQDK